MKRFTALLSKSLPVVVGCLALIWFLVRVVPKPSRAAYPCQRAAFPIASSLVIWLIAVFASAELVRKSVYYWKGTRVLAAMDCSLVASAGIGWVYFSMPASVAMAAVGAPGSAKGFKPIEAANSPMGTAIGIFPGRVVWNHDPEATSWDGRSDFLWKPENTDPERVRGMLSDSLQWLTGESSDTAAWDRLFRYFNATHGRPDAGNQAGEKLPSS